MRVIIPGTGVAVPVGVALGVGVMTLEGVADGVACGDGSVVGVACGEGSTVAVAEAEGAAVGLSVVVGGTAGVPLGEGWTDVLVAVAVTSPVGFWVAVGKGSGAPSQSAHLNPPDFTGMFVRGGLAAATSIRYALNRGCWSSGKPGESIGNRKSVSVCPSSDDVQVLDV